jgi:hypothetical protein
MDKNSTASQGKNFLSSHLNKKDKTAGCVIIGFIIFIIIIIILAIIFGYHLLIKDDVNEELKTINSKSDTVTRTVTPDDINKTDTDESLEKISGEIVAVTGIKTVDDKINLWVLSKDSESENFENPLSCMIYIYDPIGEKILRTITGNYEASRNNFRFYNYKDKVWLIRAVDSKNTDSENYIYVYDSETGDEILKTRSFIKQYEELNSGIQSLSFDNRLTGFNITAKDGRKYVYKIKDDKLLSEKKWYKEKFNSKDKKLIHYYTLMLEPHTEGRMLLYRLSVPKSKVVERDFNDSYRWDTFLQAFYRKSAREIAPDRVFFRGHLLYQDKEIILIFHNIDADPNSESELTCLDINGKELWKKPKSELFNVNINVPHIVGRIDNTLLYKVKSKGVIALDYETGEELWSFNY